MAGTSSHARAAAVAEIRADPERPGRHSKPLVVGLTVLEGFNREHPERGISQIAEDLGISRSTTHRYATTLATLGFLEQAGSRQYRLTPHAADVALALLGAMPLRDHAATPLRGVSD